MRFNSDLLIFLLVVGARFVIPLLIPRFPLPAIIACLIIDAADQSIFQKYTSLDLANYQSYDKALDIYYLTVAYLSVIRNWRNGFAMEVARFLWYYRLIGVVLFELLEKRFLLFVFPNTFEYYFIAYEAVRTCWDPRRLTRNAVLWMAGLIWVVIKLPQEWWIHIAQNDFTDFFQETIFGVEPGSPWGQTFSNRPVVAVALVAAIIALVFAGRVGWKRLPSPDWSLRFDVDKPVPDVTIEEALAGDPYYDEAKEGPELKWPIFEKIALISLVSLIFAQMLGIRLPNWQVFLATALVVTINAGISHLFVRNGTEWGSLFISTVVLVAVNSIVLAVFAAWARDGRVNRAAAIFFGVLLTLIIVMYDRFRGQRSRRIAALAI